MLLLEDRRFYTYIYLDPRKPGNYTYEIDKEIYTFDFEPFYVGKGCGNRIHEHLNESKKVSNTTMRHNKIRKILSLNLNPVTIKVKEFLTDCEAKKLEIFLIKKIGRIDLKTGVLTNLTDGGDGTSNISVETQIKKTEKYKETLKNNPEINIKRVQSRLETENITGARKKGTIKYKETLKNNPEIIKKFIEKRSETYKNNPEIMKDIQKKRLETERNNPEINIKRQKSIKEFYKRNPHKKQEEINKAKETYKNNPNISKERGKKLSKIRLEDKEMMKVAIEKYKETLRNNPEIAIEKSKKIKKSRKYKNSIINYCLELIKTQKIDNIEIPSKRYGILIWTNFKNLLETRGNENE